MKKPNALDYLSSWEFVASYDSWAQRHRSGYSRRNFAKWAQIKSPNFISLVISKQRNLKGTWLEGFIKAAGISKNEEKHLRKLCAFENTRSPQERDAAFQEIRDGLHLAEIVNLASDQLQVLTQPTAWIIYHMLDLLDQESAPSWFKKRLSFLKINAVQVSGALSILRRLDLIEEKNGKLLSKEKKLVSPDQMKSETNVIYHKNVLDEAKVALVELDPQERAFGSMIATIDQDQIESLKQEINKFGKFIVSKYASKEPVEGEVMRLNIQLYPLTKKPGENK